MQFIQFFIPIKRLLSLGGFIIFISPTLHAQTPKPKGTFYAAWGYNKDYFSNSTIHFKNAGSDNYDFTLENLKAKDRP
ncbi:MAG: hypothetical protein NTX03_07975, partial [Bacteroidetes bacterium]|nr:hypothetical protein [Bacteroidota bacterium]